MATRTYGNGATHVLRFYGGPWAGKCIIHTFEATDLNEKPPGVLILSKSTHPYVLFRTYNAEYELCYRYCETEDEQLDAYVTAIEFSTGDQT